MIPVRPVNATNKSVVEIHSNEYGDWYEIHYQNKIISEGHTICSNTLEEVLLKLGYSIKNIEVEFD